MNKKTGVCASCGSQLENGSEYTADGLEFCFRCIMELRGQDANPKPSPL